MATTTASEIRPAPLVNRTPRETRANVAKWHGEKAADAYLRGEYDDFCRHASIADRLWEAA